MTWMLTAYADLQAVHALDTYILHSIMPQVRSGVDLYNDAGILRSTGSPRHVQFSNDLVVRAQCQLKP